MLPQFRDLDNITRMIYGVAIQSYIAFRFSWLCLYSSIIDQGCRFVPYTFSETKPQMVPKDLNIGFQGLALIQGQSYNPVDVASQSCSYPAPSSWQIALWQYTSTYSKP